MGRPPTGADNAPVKIDRTLLNQVREIAPSRNMNMTQYVTEAVARQVAYDSTKAPGR